MVDFKMHVLEAYLRANDMTRIIFAKKVGVAPSRITQIIKHGERPSFDLMVKIEKVTNGTIGLSEWK